MPETCGAPSAQLVAAKVSDPDSEEICGNSTDISKGFFQSGMCEFESSEVSQAVWRSEKMSLILAESPPMAGFCELATSLQATILGIFCAK
jgi:hypothetical protein